MSTYFCPKCRHETRQECARCPACDYDLRAHARLPYADKLILALGHPIHDNRMMAALLLGRLRNRRAIPALARLLRQEKDVYLLRQALRALAEIDDPRSRQLLSAAMRHPAKLVARLASQLVSAKKSS